MAFVCWHAVWARTSIAPERLLRAMLVQVLHSIRSGRQLIEQGFALRSQAMPLMPPDEWNAKRNRSYGHLDLSQNLEEFLDRSPTILTAV
ncbi:hypothetical protein OKW43_006441 [Paraburkholderia sp. WC7.3g]